MSKELLNFLCTLVDSFGRKIMLAVTCSKGRDHRTVTAAAAGSKD